MDSFDCAVVGAGVVGLAIANAIAQSGRNVLVLESESAIGTGSSSRNSEVVHAGLYYEPGSLKARLCVEGRRLLYNYCTSRSVAFRRTGKFIVGTVPQHDATLRAILNRARANEVEDIDWIDASEARNAEPALSCLFALDSRQTGIVDSHGLMNALRNDIEQVGGIVALEAPLVRAQRRANTWELDVGGSEPISIECQWLVNAAGLDAQSVAARIQGLDSRTIPQRHLARGCYFALSAPSPFTRLIYPVPSDGGLGVHLTLDLGSQARFGPDVEWIDEVNYTVAPSRAEIFYAEIRRYWPAMPDDSLRPAFAGIRSKLSGPGQPARDFMIDGPTAHGVPCLVNLFGIESPGLTASLAIGALVTELVHESN